MHLEAMQAKIQQSVNDLLTEQLLDSNYPIKNEQLFQFEGSPDFTLFPFGIKLKKPTLDYIYYQNKIYQISLAKVIVNFSPFEALKNKQINQQSMKIILYNPLIAIREVDKHKLQVEQFNVLRQIHQSLQTQSIKVEKWKIHKGSISYADKEFLNAINLNIDNSDQRFETKGSFKASNEKTTVDILIDYNTKQFDIGLFANLFSFRAKNSFTKQPIVPTLPATTTQTTNSKTVSTTYNGEMRFGVRNLQSFLQKFLIFDHNSWLNKIIFNGQLNMNSQSFSFEKGVLKLENINIMSEVINGVAYSNTSKNYQGKLETHISLQLPSLNFDRLFQGLFSTVSVYSVKAPNLVKIEEESPASEFDLQSFMGSLSNNLQHSSNSQTNESSQDIVVSGINIDITIGSLRYMNESFKDVNINIQNYISQQQDIFMIQPFSMFDNSDNLYIIQGVIADGNFYGRLFSSGQELSEILQWTRLRNKKSVRPGTWGSYQLMGEINLSNDQLKLNNLFLSSNEIMAKANLVLSDLSTKMKLGGECSVYNMDFYQYFTAPKAPKPFKSPINTTPQAESATATAASATTADSSTKDSEAAAQTEQTATTAAADRSPATAKTVETAKTAEPDPPTTTTDANSTSSAVNSPNPSDNLQTDNQQMLELLIANNNYNELDFKLLTLNNLWLNIGLTVNFYNSRFGSEIKFNDGSFTLNSSEGFLEFDNIKFFHNTSYYQRDHTAKFSINIKTAEPEVMVNLDLASLAINQPTQNADIQLNYLDSNKDLVDLFFQLIPLRGITGRVEFNIEDLYLYDLHIKNLTTAGSDFIGSGVIFPDITFDALSGHFKADASLSSLNPKNLTASISATDVDLKSLAQQFNLSIADQLSGTLGMGGVLKSSGKNWGEFVKNLNIAFKVNSNNIAVYGLGLNDLVSKSLYPIENRKLLTDLNKFYFSRSRNTQFSLTEAVLRKKPGVGPIDLRIVTKNKLYNTSTQGQIQPNYNFLTKGALNLLSNVVFITGTQKNAMSLRIVSQTAGPFDSLKTVANFSQVYSYLNYYWSLDKTMKKLLLPEMDNFQEEQLDIDAEIDKIKAESTDKANDTATTTTQNEANTTTEQNDTNTTTEQLNTTTAEQLDPTAIEQNNTVPTTEQHTAATTEQPNSTAATEKHESATTIEQNDTIATEDRTADTNGDKITSEINASNSNNIDTSKTSSSAEIQPSLQEVTNPNPSNATESNAIESNATQPNSSSVSASTSTNDPSSANPQRENALTNTSENPKLTTLTEIKPASTAQIAASNEENSNTTESQTTNSNNIEPQTTTINERVSESPILNDQDSATNDASIAAQEQKS